MRATLPLLFLLACRDKDETPTDTGFTLSDCDPIAPTQCGLPFPSTFYMRQDSASPTGWRVALGDTTLPINANHDQPAPTYWNERDGWSPLSPMLAHLPGVSLDGLIGHDDLGAYEDAEAKTIVVDVDTGERVPHFVELDMSGDDEDRRLLILQPVTPMQYGHRYAVGLRGLVDEAGVAIEPSPAFVALRDGGTVDDDTIATDDIEGRRDVYDTVVFPALEAAGWSRGETQLAWDFVVGSEEGITGRARWLRDDALDRVADGPTYEITSVEEFSAEENEHTARRVHGKMTVPLYTTEDYPGAFLTRDADGMPYANGETEVGFTIIVPRTLVEDPRPARIVQYGHGLLGDRGEVEGGYLAEMADRYGYILFATDWTGMKGEDIISITAMIATDLGDFAFLPERSMQGFVEFLCMMRLMSGPMVNDEALMATDPDSGEPVALIDPDRRSYYGNSQGGILGGSYIALSPDIERATLGVAGMPYALLLMRSHDFEDFLTMFRTMYPDPAHVMLWLGYMQTLWDQGEPAGYGLSVNQSPLADTPAKDVLIQVAVGDVQVTTLGAHIMARAYGAKLIDEPVRPVWGLETVPSGWAGSGLVEFDYGLEEPFENIPPTGEDPHEWPRRELAGQEQMYTFFETGLIENFCEGACFEDPE